MVKNTFLIFLLFLVLGCKKQADKNSLSVPDSWEGILEEARGSQLTMMMWRGDPSIQVYMDRMAAEIKEAYDITLQFADGQGNIIVQTLISEYQAGNEQSEIDIIWINGETFYQLRELDFLYGPFLNMLPNAENIRMTDPFIAKDFQKPINGMECPWGNVQMTYIYDSKDVNAPPQTRKDLYKWVRKNPGKFTWDVHFTGMTLLKSWLMDIAGHNQLYGEFDPIKYDMYSKKLWMYIDSIRPYLWRKGETFPSSVAPLHQMFVKGEVDFTFSNNDAEVENKIANNIFDSTARAYVPHMGTIQNSHYLGIPKRSYNKSAALVVINHLLSFDAQERKSNPRIWGDGTVLDTTFQSAEMRYFAPSRSSIQKYALQELAPEYMIHLYDDFQKYIRGELED